MLYIDYDNEHRVTNDIEADKAVQKIAEIVREKERINAIFEHNINELLNSQRSKNEHFDKQIRHYKDLLMPYMMTQKCRETKTQQSYELASGRLVYKKPSIAYERDEKALTEWLKQNHPEFIKVKESPAWDELKKTTTVTGESVVDADGVIVEGVTIKPVDGMFEVKIDNINDDDGGNYEPLGKAD